MHGLRRTARHRVSTKWGASAQVKGLCSGMFVGTLVNSVIYAWMCGRTDWDKVGSLFECWGLNLRSDV